MFDLSIVAPGCRKPQASRGAACVGPGSPFHSLSPMNQHLFAAFIATSFVLAVTPGPGVVYVVARTAAQGKLAGLASVADVAVGNLPNALAASFGLAALFASSAVAFTLVKFAGGADLIYLGVQALRSRPAAAALAAFGTPDFGRIFRDGFTVALLNPKTAVFFAALLPQFLEPSQSAAAQGVVLAFVFVCVAAITDSAYVFAASVARSKLGNATRSHRLGRCATAATFLGSGIFAAVSGSRPSW